VETNVVKVWIYKKKKKERNNKLKGIICRMKKKNAKEVNNVEII